MEQAQQYVGIDFHRRRSVIVRMNGAGEILGVEQVDNHPEELLAALAKAGPNPEVALESTYGWYWAADLLASAGAKVHLVHPLGLNWSTRRVKNDVRDATELANRLRRGDLPESYVAPPELRDLREMVRYRQKLTSWRTSAKAQYHGVMAKCGVLPTMTDMFCPTGLAILDEIPFEGSFLVRAESLRDCLELVEREITMMERHIARALKGHEGYRAIQAISGVGPILAAIFVAEIGDVSRFPSARHLCSWAGLTPTHKESDTKVQRGHITKQGSNLVRWAAVEAVGRYHGGDAIRPAWARVTKRRGKMIGRVAAARRILTLVYYGLRDGHISCLDREAA